MQSMWPFNVLLISISFLKFNFLKIIDVSDPPDAKQFYLGLKAILLTNPVWYFLQLTISLLSILCKITSPWLDPHAMRNPSALMSISKII
jgi:hypothetical protein